MHWMCQWAQLEDHNAADCCETGSFGTVKYLLNTGWWLQKYVHVIIDPLQGTLPCVNDRIRSVFAVAKILKCVQPRTVP